MEFCGINSYDQRFVYCSPSFIPNQPSPFPDCEEIIRVKNGGKYILAYYSTLTSTDESQQRLFC